jgi:DNA-binding IclR family transcriptional regulator
VAADRAPSPDYRVELASTWTEAMKLRKVYRALLRQLGLDQSHYVRTSTYLSYVAVYIARSDGKPMVGSPAFMAMTASNTAA